MASPILPSNAADPTGVDRLERGAIIRLNKVVNNARAIYAGLIDRIGYAPVVNQKYSFQLSAEQLLSLLEIAGDDVDRLFQAHNADQIWFFDEYVRTAYQRGTAQEFANLSAQSPVYAQERQGLLGLLRSSSYRDRLGILKARIVEGVKGFAQSIKTRLSDAFTRAIGYGLSPSEIKKAMKEQDRALKAQGALMARTEVAGALRQARQDETEQANDDGYRTMLLHLSAFAPTTRPSHAARHGNLCTVAEVRSWYSKNGNRYNCKCSHIAVLVDKDNNPLSKTILRRAMSMRSTN